MKIQWKNLAICLVIPLAAGGLSALLTKTGMEAFETINKPSLTLPDWIFPVAWTILYILMGIASYLVSISRKPTRIALAVYGMQLAFNFLWSIIFFNLGLYLFAFIWLVLLWLLILATAILFYPIAKPAGYLILPYLLWVTFAGYLNYFIYLLN